MSTPVIIEFVGLPAVGKTTLSRTVAAQLQREEYIITQSTADTEQLEIVTRILTKSKFAFQWIITQPRGIKTTFSQVAATNQDTESDFLRVLFNLSYIGGIMTNQRSTEEICLLDQGPYQGVWSVGLQADNPWPELFNRFGDYLNQTTPDLVVCVDAEIDTIADRLAQRSGGDTRLSADSSQFDRAVAGYEELKTQLATADCRTITVTNESKADLEPNAAHIADEIRSLSQSK